MPESFVDHAGFSLWTENFGQDSSPCVLLITSTQAIWWDADFCRSLAEADRHVIRFDNRDTGLSSTAREGAQPYSIDDLVGDAVAVLDAYGVVAAHVVGCFTGGFVAQRLALLHPDRLETLTLISTTPVLREAAHAVLRGSSAGLDLPLPHSADQAELEDAVAPWRSELDNDRRTYVENQLHVLRLECGSRFAFDEEYWRALITCTSERARDLRGHYRQWDALLTASPDLRPQLRSLKTPTLILHGTEDRTIPVEHAEALADAIPNARLVAIEGLGHQFHKALYPLWTTEIVAHTSIKRRDLPGLSH